MRHPGDEELQAYLDGDATVDASRVTDHLRECPACRRVCEEYRMLYAALADERHVSVPAEAAGRAPAFGTEEGRRARAADRADAVVGTWALAALAVAAAVFVRAGGLGPGANRVASAFGQLLTQSFGLLVSLWHPFTGPNNEAGAVAVAVVAVLAASGAIALDCLLLEPHLKGNAP